MPVVKLIIVMLASYNTSLNFFRKKYIDSAMWFIVMLLVGLMYIGVI